MSFTVLDGFNELARERNDSLAGTGYGLRRVQRVSPRDGASPKTWELSAPSGECPPAPP
jgi:hypothetical protein